MTELDRLISAAFSSEGKQEDVYKVYLALLRATLFLPVQKEDTTSHQDTQEPFKPLFTKIENDYYLLAFDTRDRLIAWAGDQLDHINSVEISGHDIILGMGLRVYLCLNVGTEFYKEFSPDEVNRLKTIVARIDQVNNH